MTSAFRITLAAAAALLGAFSCTKDGKAGPAATDKPKDISPDTVVATYSGKKITLKELDEYLGEQLEELERQKHQLRRQGIDQMILEQMVTAEAEKKGMTKEQWLKSEIDDKVPPPSDQEIQQMFEMSKGQLGADAKLEDWKERIVAVATRPQRQERAQKVFEGMLKQANVQVTLPEPPRRRKQVEAKGPSRGPENAKVTIVEFSDFECPFCSRATGTVDEVMQAYAGKVRLVFRHFPLDFHKRAQKAAEASMCAHEQGRFWEYHDTLFKNQQKLEIAELKEHAKSLGLDTAKFDQCLDSGRFEKAVKDDMAAGQKVGVSGTPAFFINGVMLSGAQPLEEFKKIIDQELATN